MSFEDTTRNYRQRLYLNEATITDDVDRFDYSKMLGDADDMVRKLKFKMIELIAFSFDIDGPTFFVDCCEVNRNNELYRLEYALVRQYFATQQCPYLVIREREPW